MIVFRRLSQARLLLIKKADLGSFLIMVRKCHLMAVIFVLLICASSHSKQGLVVKQMQDSTSEDVKKQVIISIGDGGGDFSPTLKLKKEDHVMPRKDFPLHNLILKSSVPIKPEVHEWSDGDELNNIMLHLIDPLEA
ncbi:thiamine phosphate phosphatase-like protein [Tanacetum coccineum]